MIKRSDINDHQAAIAAVQHGMGYADLGDIEFIGMDGHSMRPLTTSSPSL